jgi:hypothetical protein
MTGPDLRDLLDRADAARSAGEGGVAGALYMEAIGVARATDDLGTWTRAALGAASVHLFGTEPGRLAAELYDVLARTVDPAVRSRVAAALARVWAYSGYPDRGARFASEAVEGAAQLDDPELLADALDSALTTHWGPDELSLRGELTAQLSEVAVHVLDPTTRLQATLWNLEVACQSLDIPAMYRHLRILERLGEESDRALFFAASRRLTLDLLRGRTDTVDALVATAEAAGRRAGLADWWMVVESMKGYAGLYTGDPAACTILAVECAEFGVTEGNATISSEAAFLYAYAGQHDRAATVLDGLVGAALEHLPRDANWLLTVQCTLLAALEVGHHELTATAERLLAPYEGRAVFNTGVVAFNGLTDHSLALAASRHGDLAEAERLRRTALATYTRLGAAWWRDRLLADLPGDATPTALRLHPDDSGGWLVGPAESPVRVRAFRGLTYLHHLIRMPGQAVSALDLTAGFGPTVVQHDLGQTLDETALRAFRRRLADLHQEITDAEADVDLARLDALRDERDALLDEVGAATGLAGRPRSSGSTEERARVAVTKAIGTALQHLDVAAPTTARLLRTSIRTGRTCCYEADGSVTWIVSDQSFSTGA